MARHPHRTARRGGGALGCLLLACLWTTSAAAKDPCPFGYGSAVSRDLRPISHLFIVVTYRRECGVAGLRDRLALRSVHEARGCPVDSGLGRYVTDFLDAPLEDWNRHPGIALIRGRDPVGYHGFCRMAQAVPWPAGDASFLLARPEAAGADRLPAYQAFWAHLDAMQTELTWLMKRDFP